MKKNIIGAALLTSLLLSGCSGNSLTETTAAGSGTSVVAASADVIQSSEEKTQQASPVVIELPIAEDGESEEESKALETEETTTTAVAEPTIEAQIEGGRADIIPADIVNYGDLVFSGNAAYCLYGYLDEVADVYTAAVNLYADNLAGRVNVYSMIVPTNLLVMPEEYRSQLVGFDMSSDIFKIRQRMSVNVSSVQVIEKLSEHKDEYIYFRTDHHWTQLGAYYAYRAFCDIKGFTPHMLSEYETVRLDGFLGSSYYNYGQSPVLAATPDFLRSFIPKSNLSLAVTKLNGETVDWPIINLAQFENTNKYLTYICGDNPYSVITNHDINDGSTCLIVKDSFGNAFIPFLADHYNYVYIVDYRYYSGGLLTLINEKGVTDLIFENALSLADDVAARWISGTYY